MTLAMQTSSSASSSMPRSRFTTPTLTDYDLYTSSNDVSPDIELSSIAEQGNLSDGEPGTPSKRDTSARD